MATDAELDAAVQRVLGAYLAQGDPYTVLPLVDPDTGLLPPPTVDAIREGLADATDVEELDALVTDGRLGEAELAATYVRFLDTNGAPLVGKLVTITVDTVTESISDITVEDI